jgi:hypothetical protein
MSLSDTFPGGVAAADIIVAPPILLERDLGRIEHHLGVATEVGAGLEIDQFELLRRNLDETIPIGRRLGRQRRERKQGRANRGNEA